jgi:CDP-glucose 4,6-dehydratase
VEQLDPQGSSAVWRDRGVFITGANGFIGAWVAHALVAAGARVVALVRDSIPNGGLRLHGLRDSLAVVDGDLANLPLLHRVLAEHEISVCFHLAAQAIVQVGDRSPVGTFASNVTGTANLLEACRLAGVRMAVIASSDKAYGRSQDLPYREDMPLLGASPYEASKVATEVIARSYATTYGLCIGVTRCANVYGGGDLNFSRLVPDTFRSVLAGKGPVLRSDGSPKRDFIYAEDAADAYLRLGRHCLETQHAGSLEAFNFGWGRPVTVLELTRLILAVCDRKDLNPVILGDGKASSEIQDQYLDSSLARTRLGWRPRFDLRRGLERTRDWYSSFLANGFAPVDLLPAAQSGSGVR